jgi:glycosyltransferase involved in cell wall biosynthesis
MRTTFILRGWSTLPVATFRISYEYANRLAERGHVVHIVHPIDMDNTHGRMWKAFARMRRSMGSMARGRWFYLHPAIHSTIVPSLDSRYVPDADSVIATDWPTANWVDGYPARKGEKYYLIQGYEAWLENRGHIDKTWKLNLKKIVISKWLQSIANNFGETAEWVPNAIDADMYAVVRPVDQRNGFSLGMLYHSAPYKGFDDGLKAVALARAKYPGIRLDLFGVFPKPGGLPRWASYTRNPPLKRLIGLYNRIGIFVHSSLYEGWALPPAEAMACGCAVVATDSKGILDYAEHDKTALISPVRSPRDLSENIVRLIENPVKRIELARAAKARIDQFTWDASVEKFERVLLGTTEAGMAQGMVK